MIYTYYDYLNKYQKVVTYLIANASKKGFAFPYIQRAIAYSDTFSEFEKSNVTSIAFDSVEKIYLNIFGYQDSFEADDYGIYGWIGYAYIDLFLTYKVTFELMFYVLPIEEMINKYPVYHEMSITQLRDVFQSRIRYSLLDALLKAKQISTKRLAETSGVSESTLRAIRYGSRNIDNLEFKSVIRIADTLNIKIESLTHLNLKLD